MAMFDTFSTYDHDKPLLADLGLREFSGKAWEEVYVGEVKVENSTVKVWVQGAPAQFWKFEVRLENEVYRIETGSGSMTTYWPLVEQVARGCFVIERRSAPVRQP
jgi:hypothetical protein